MIETLKKPTYSIKTMLRNRLKRRRKTFASLEYMNYLKQKYPHLDLDHILGSNKTKLNDFLLCPLPHELHMKIENGIEIQGYSFEERLMYAIEELLDYVEHVTANTEKFIELSGVKNEM